MIGKNISNKELIELRLKFYVDLLREKQLLPVIGAEIGVWKGGLSLPLILELGIDVGRMYGVDPYVVFYNEHGRKVFKPNWEQRHWDELYRKIAFRVVLGYVNYTLIRMKSEDAVYVIPDCLGFVYIDGRHDYHGVIEDISLWEEKIKRGGIISGNDYGGKKYKSVTRAVDDYAKLHGRKIRNPIYGEWYWIVGE